MHLGGEEVGQPTQKKRKEIERRKERKDKYTKHRPNLSYLKRWDESHLEN